MSLYSIWKDWANREHLTTSEQQQFVKFWIFYKSCFIHKVLIWPEVFFIQEVSGAYTFPFLDRDELKKVAFRARKISGTSRHFTLAVPFSTQVHKWIPANLILRVTQRWTSIPSGSGGEILLVASWYRNRDTLQPDGPLGLYADFYYRILSLPWFENNIEDKFRKESKLSLARQTLSPLNYLWFNWSNQNLLQTFEASKSYFKLIRLMR